jgi:predicted 3-demethylubiquinone-9 3-methyltransferase (glyoxalase superfamily)
VISAKPFVWLPERAGEAVQFYLRTFEGSRVLSETSIDGPEGAGTNLVIATLEIAGMPVTIFGGGPFMSPNQAVSIFVECDTQDEVDRLWDALSSSGGGGRCGWVTDPYGLTWQIVPRLLGTLLSDPDREGAERVRLAMLEMDKLDSAVLQAAYDTP